MVKNFFNRKICGAVFFAKMFAANVVFAAKENYDDRTESAIERLGGASGGFEGTLGSDAADKINFANQIAELKKSLPDTIAAETAKNLPPFGDATGFVAAGAIALIVLLAIALIVLSRSLSGKIHTRVSKEKFAKLDATVKAQSDEIKRLRGEIDVLKESIKRAEAATTVPKEAAPKIAPVRAAAPKETAPPAPTIADEYGEFVAEYNALQKKTGLEARTAKQDFIKKFAVKAFNCTNFEARMNDPALAPVFSDAESPAMGRYWAYAVRGDIFAVVPNINPYEAQNHTAGAMGEVFASNFANGSTYRSIAVVKPALFKGEWQLDERGELKLG